MLVLLLPHWLPIWSHLLIVTPWRQIIVCVCRNTLCSEISGLFWASQTYQHGKPATVMNAGLSAVMALRSINVIIMGQNQQQHHQRGVNLNRACRFSKHFPKICVKIRFVTEALSVCWHREKEETKLSLKISPEWMKTTQQHTRVNSSLLHTPLIQMKHYINHHRAVLIIM